MAVVGLPDFSKVVSSGSVQRSAVQCSGHACLLKLLLADCATTSINLLFLSETHCISLRCLSCVALIVFALGTPRLLLFKATTCTVLICNPHHPVCGASEQLPDGILACCQPQNGCKKLQAQITVCEADCKSLVALGGLGFLSG
jgi:hypothetical protein